MLTFRSLASPFLAVLCLYSIPGCGSDENTLGSTGNTAAGTDGAAGSSSSGSDSATTPQCAPAGAGACQYCPNGYLSGPGGCRTCECKPDVSQSDGAVTWQDDTGPSETDAAPTDQTDSG